MWKIKFMDRCLTCLWSLWQSCTRLVCQWSRRHSGLAAWAMRSMWKSCSRCPHSAWCFHLPYWIGHDCLCLWWSCSDSHCWSRLCWCADWALHHAAAVLVFANEAVAVDWRSVAAWAWSISAKVVSFVCLHWLAACSMVWHTSHFW